MSLNTEQQVEKYREHPAVNQTLLKGLIDPSKITTKDFSEHMGTIVDLRLYTPGLFMKGYHVAADETSVSDAIKEILREVYSITNGDSLEAVKGMIIQSARARNYQKNIVDDQKLLNNILVVKGGEAYYKGLLEAMGKIVINSIDFALSSKIMVKMRAAIAEMNTRFPGDMISQMAIYFMYSGVECKALLDFAIFDDELKHVKIVDTKVTDVPHSKYPAHAIGFRYDFQLAFYYQAMVWYLNNTEGFENWTVTFPSLLVYSTVTETVVEYRLSEVDLHIGRWGAKNTKTWELRNAPMLGTSATFDRDYTVYGFDDAIQLYLNSNQSSNNTGLFDASSNHSYTKSNEGLWVG